MEGPSVVVKDELSTRLRGQASIQCRMDFGDDAFPQRCGPEAPLSCGSGERHGQRHRTAGEHSHFHSSESCRTCHVGQGVEQMMQGGRELGFGEESADAEVAAQSERHVFGSCAEGVRRGKVLTKDVKPVRRGEAPFVPVGRADETGDGRPLWNGTATELHLVGGLPGDHLNGRAEAQGFSDGMADEAAVFPHGCQLVGMGEQIEEQLREGLLRRFPAACDQQTAEGPDVVVGQVRPVHLSLAESGDEVAAGVLSALADEREQVSAELGACAQPVGSHLGILGKVAEEGDD